MSETMRAVAAISNCAIGNGLFLAKLKIALDVMAVVPSLYHGDVLNAIFPIAAEEAAENG